MSLDTLKSNGQSFRNPVVSGAEGIINRGLELSSSAVTAVRDRLRPSTESNVLSVDQPSGVVPGWQNRVIRWPEAGLSTLTRAGNVLERQIPGIGGNKEASMGLLTPEINGTSVVESESPSLLQRGRNTLNRLGTTAAVGLAVAEGIALYTAASATMSKKSREFERKQNEIMSDISNERAAKKAFEQLVADTVSGSLEEALRRKQMTPKEVKAYIEQKTKEFNRDRPRVWGIPMTGRAQRKKR